MINFADVVAVAGNVVGSVLVAGDFGKNYALAGYIFFLAGSIAAFYLLYGSTASPSLMYINVYFTAVNIFGIVRRIRAKS